MWCIQAVPFVKIIQFSQLNNLGVWDIGYDCSLSSNPDVQIRKNS